MTPTIGRIVHYVNAGLHQAAIITSAWDWNGEIQVTLCVLPAHEPPFPIFGPRQDEDGKAHNTWHWPERDDEAER